MQIIERMNHLLDQVMPLAIRGRVVHASGTVIKAVVPNVKIGELCVLRTPFESQHLLTEVIGFSEKSVLLSPIGEISGISSDTRVYPTNRILQIPVGESLLGRVIDGLGRPLDIDEKGPLTAQGYYPIQATPPGPLKRRMITRPLSLGVRSIDAAITCGEGQRMGIFGAAGVGKSSLLAMLCKNATADVNVLALIGERGREVREFIKNDLGEDGLKKSVVIVSTSDKSAIERLKAAYAATAIAEYFRNNGKRVLLLFDSITRFARALREIGLAAGEPPTRRGFPPSVFAALPKLMERSGMSDKGSITAFYTVLVEGDDMTEPIADETRSILDGHVILSNQLASANHFPAIDVTKSVSRVMNKITTAAHLADAGRLRDLIHNYQELELLLKLGEYKVGTDAESDEAIAKNKTINTFLKQDVNEHSDYAETLEKLSGIIHS